MSMVASLLFLPAQKKALNEFLKIKKGNTPRET
jgi:hypothetical protein